MELNETDIETLIIRVEEYSKTTIELGKLKFVEKTADVSSKFISRMILTIVLSLFTIILNIGIAFWLGDLLGKDYYGFLCVAAFYGLSGVILVLLHRRIYTRLKNSFISQMLN